MLFSEFQCSTIGGSADTGGSDNTATMQIDKEIWRYLDKFDSLVNIYVAV